MNNVTLYSIIVAYINATHIYVINLSQKNKL